jgi:hypothetical protein
LAKALTCFRKDTGKRHQSALIEAHCARMKNATKLIPEDLRDFLSAHEGRWITFDRTLQPQMEVDSLEFYSPSEVKLQPFTIHTHEYYLNHDEQGDDPELRYDIEGIALIQGCNSYDPDGILVYFPAYQEYGSWDCDHGVITMFPGVDWPAIETHLAEYVNAQWYPGMVEAYLLRPWADKRCSGLKPKPSH